MDDQREDTTDYEGVIAEVLQDALNASSDDPCIVVNWVCVADIRYEDGGYGVALKTPLGLPWWIVEGMLEQATMVGPYQGNGGDDD